MITSSPPGQSPNPSKDILFTISSLNLPCLAFHHAGDRSTVLFNALEKKPVAGVDIGELEKTTICPTAHGFVLARNPSSKATFLWSPQDHAKIDLPPLLGLADELLIHCHCILSDEPAAPNCVVLLVQPDAPIIRYCRLGDTDQWENYEYDIGTLALPDWDTEEKVVICPIAACRGRFYFNSTPTSLGVIDFSSAAGPAFSTVEIDGESADEIYGHETSKDCSAGAYVYLVESQQELYMVRLRLSLQEYWEIEGVSVHRMDFGRRRWRREDDLGDRVFLLSLLYFGASSSCSAGECGLRRNCVYLPCAREKVLRIFSVKDESIEVQKLDGAPQADKVLDTS